MMTAIGIVLVVIGLGLAALIGFANGMSDAPTESGVSVRIPLAAAALGVALIVYAVMS